jgi:uncharacterized protein YpmS
MFDVRCSMLDGRWSMLVLVLVLLLVLVLVLLLLLVLVYHDQKFSTNRMNFQIHFPLTNRHANLTGLQVDTIGDV